MAKENIGKLIHYISNVIHNNYETLENIELSLDTDKEYCLEAIKASKEERTQAFIAFEKLKTSLKEAGLNE